VLYGLFNEGYSATEGPALVRPTLCTEAIRLTRLLATLMPDEPDVMALLSLMLLHDARWRARVGDAGPCSRWKSRIAGCGHGLHR
jgi:RNA polymerase sigma-70 factor (ECF subfamily)